MTNADMSLNYWIISRILWNFVTLIFKHNMENMCVTDMWEILNTSHSVRVPQSNQIFFIKNWFAYTSIANIFSSCEFFTDNKTLRLRLL